MKHTLGNTYLQWSRLLVHAALNPFREPPAISSDGARAVIRAVRNLQYLKFYPQRENLVLGVIDEVLVGIADDDRARALTSDCCWTGSIHTTASPHSSHLALALGAGLRVRSPPPN